MATYRLRAPDGKVYTLEGPEGASKEELVQVLRAKLAERATPDPEPETESEGLFQEIGEGLLSGSSKAVQGLVETGTLLYDLAADEDLTSDVTQRFENFRASLGLDPVGLPGKAAEIITQFVVPGGLAAKAVGKGVKVADKALSKKDVLLLPAQIAVDPIGTVVKRTAALSPKLRGETVLGTKFGRQKEAFRKGETLKDLSKPEKFALGAATLGAVAGADVMVATDDITTIADFFEGGPTQTIREIGLSGREEALRRLGNKLKIGTETGAVIAATPPVLGAAATGLGFVGDKAAGVAAPVLSPVARAVRESSAVRKTSDYLKDLEKRRLQDTISRAGGAETTLKNIKLKVPLIDAEFKFGEALLSDFLALFRPRGYLPYDIFLSRALIAEEGTAAITRAKATLASFQDNLTEAIESYRKEYGGESNLIKQQFFNNVEAALTATKTEDLNRAIAELPENLRADVRAMANQLDSAQSAVLNSDYFKNISRVTGVNQATGEVTDPRNAENFRQLIRRNLNGFLRRRFALFEDANYEPTQQVLNEAIDGFLGDSDTTLYYLKELFKAGVPSDQRLARLGLKRDGEDIVLETVTQEQARDRAEIAANAFLEAHKVKNRGLTETRTTIARDRLNPALFLRKGGLPLYQRKLLGEFLDVDEAFLGTVADLAEFKAIDQFYGKIRNSVDTNPGLRNLFVDMRIKTPEDPGSPMGQAQIAQQRERNVSLVNLGYKVLDGRIGKEGDKYGLLLPSLQDLGEPGPLLSGYGSLQGFAVPKPVFDYLSRTIQGQELHFTGLGLSALSGLVQAKSAVQYAKTVLSPITQIRNVTSASLFALMQGNIGRGGNLAESYNLVLQSFSRKPEAEVLDELTDMQRRGVLGSQAELREVQDLIRKGVGTKELESEAFVEGLKVVPDYGETVAKTKFGRVVSAGQKIGKSALKTAEKAYAGGDDLWKIYNYKFEQQKLRNALRGTSADEAYQIIKGRPAPQGTRIDVEELIKDEAADIVRNTVPNYNMVPEVIKGLRKVPIMGNFVSFPAEILRTGAGTVERGIKELSSTNPEIQKIGLKRLTGALFTTAVFPATLQNIAMSLTGVTKDELEAYKKTLAPPWQKEARLIPTGRDKKGLPLFINYSYANPYEIVESMVVGGLNAYEEAKARGLDPSVGVAAAIERSTVKFFEPFLGESILAARIFDVTDFLGGRAGQTETGARIYSDEDSKPTKVYRSIMHVADAFIPNISPVSISLGEPSVKRFARSWIASTGLLDGVVSPKDVQGIERQIAGELIRGMTGLTEENINVARGLEFMGLEYRQDRREVGSIFNRIGTDKNLASSEAIFDAFVAANEAKYKVDTRLKIKIDELKKLGVSEREIKNILKDKVGRKTLNRILRNTFDPYEISETTEDIMKENKTWGLVPKSRIRTYSRSQDRMPLRQEALQQEEREPTVRESAPSTPRTRTRNPVGTTNINVPNVQPPTGPVSQTSPILIPDPITRALAEQLETRRG